MNLQTYRGLKAQMALVLTAASGGWVNPAHLTRHARSDGKWVGFTQRMPTPGKRQKYRRK